MKIKYLLFLSIVCILFFLAGLGISGIYFIHKNIVLSNDQLKCPIQSIIPQISLPPTWLLKENLPGNSFATAFSLITGITTQGTLNNDNAIDYYSFILKDPSQIIIDVTNVPKSLYWVLYDSEFKEIASTYRVGTSRGSTQVSLQNPGKYYIKVWADYHQLNNYPYTIRLNILPYFE